MNYKIKTMRTILCLLLCGLLSNSLFAQQVSIIPKPVSLKTSPGTFALSKSTVIVIAKEDDRKSANFLNDYLQQIYGFKLAIAKTGTANTVRMTTRDASSTKEAYSMSVASSGVNIAGDSPAGTFYGIQTLIQLLPTEKAASLKVPYVAVEDEPRFSYRGLHLDVGRHMFPVSFIKKYIDYIALHKMNYFHWHLTEDQGWRIEIKKYPLLTQVGGFRKSTIIGRAPGKGEDNVPYGGFYTQEEVKEVVKYATDRHVNVIPEIEMPGHASAALASYPFLGCPGTGPYKVEGSWGVFDDIYCAGKDSTFKFLEDVLDEVIPLFPNQYVHVGGDEAPKNNWKICPLCQKRIKDNDLKDEHGLQSYFIQRMEKYINSKGKTMIGWDEILEGGLAPNALVMSWRGEAGGIEAAKQHHQVIMTPGTYVYFDHSQTLKEDSVTIGSYLPIEKVYSYEPIPKELNAEEGKYVLGAQANLWSEYMRYPAKVEYMLFPRVAALSEVLWSTKESRNWADFEPRLLTQFKRYDLWNVNYSKAYFGIQTTLAPAADHNGIVVTMATKDATGKLKQGLKGASLTDYASPITVTSTSQLNGLYYNTKGAKVDSVGLKFNINKATGKNITLTAQPVATAAGNGGFSLVDGILNEAGGRSLESLGFDKDLEAVIDLNTAQSVSSVTVHTLNAGGTTVYPPESVSILASADGQTFKPLTATTNVTAAASKSIYAVGFAPETARYIKVVIKRTPVVPVGKRGAGQPTMMFLDEIQIN
jgi:hexosaminidase